MIVTKQSILSGKISSLELDVTDEQLMLYSENTKHVQEIFPHLSPDEREFLMTGITPSEWEETFGFPR